MTKQEIINTVEMILNEAHTAVLATTDQQGKPHIRWMTPALLRGRTGAVYAVTSPRFGNVVQLEDFRGKVVFLNFWATWCPPCRIEMPSMEKLYNKFKDDRFTILAVDMQEDSETVKRFKESFKLSFPILLDEEGAVGAYYGVMALPATYFIDREGYLYAAALGARDWSGEDAVQLIRHLLAN